MRMPGIAEIILIIIVACIVLIAIRLIGTPARRRSQRLAREAAAAEEEDNEKTIKRTRRSRLQVAGVIAIILGIVILLSSFGLVKWVFWGPIWALVIVAIGAVTIFVARRR